MRPFAGEGTKATKAGGFLTLHHITSASLDIFKRADGLSLERILHGGDRKPQDARVTPGIRDRGSMNERSEGNSDSEKSGNHGSDQMNGMRTRLFYL